MNRTLEDFAEIVKRYWSNHGGYRPAAEDTHFDAEGHFHDNPHFLPPDLSTMFSPSTLRAIAVDLGRMGDTIEATGLLADRSMEDVLRSLAEAREHDPNCSGPRVLRDLERSLWPHPIRMREHGDPGQPSGDDLSQTSMSDFILNLGGFKNVEEFKVAEKAALEEARRKWDRQPGESDESYYGRLKCSAVFRPNKNGGFDLVYGSDPHLEDKLK